MELVGELADNMWTVPTDAEALLDSYLVAQQPGAHAASQVRVGAVVDHGFGLMSAVRSSTETPGGWTDERIEVNLPARQATVPRLTASGSGVVLCVGDDGVEEAISLASRYSHGLRISCYDESGRRLNGAGEPPVLSRAVECAVAAEEALRAHDVAAYAWALARLNCLRADNGWGCQYAEICDPAGFDDPLAAEIAGFTMEEWTTYGVVADFRCHADVVSPHDFARVLLTSVGQGLRLSPDALLVATCRPGWEAMSLSVDQCIRQTLLPRNRVESAISELVGVGWCEHPISAETALAMKGIDLLRAEAEQHGIRGRSTRDIAARVVALVNADEVDRITARLGVSRDGVLMAVPFDRSVGPAASDLAQRLTHRSSMSTPLTFGEHSVTRPEPFPALAAIDWDNLTSDEFDEVVTQVRAGASEGDPVTGVGDSDGLEHLREFVAFVQALDESGSEDEANALLAAALMMMSNLVRRRRG